MPLADHFDLTWTPKNVIRASNQQMHRNMTQTVLYLEGYCKRLISRGNRGGDNPSEPGEPPKVVTGTLRSSIGHAVEVRPGVIIGSIGVRKGPAQEYAMRLELGFVGTDSKGRKYDQKPRPFLRPTLNDNTAKISNMLKAGR